MHLNMRFHPDNKSISQSQNLPIDPNSQETNKTQQKMWDKLDLLLRQTCVSLPYDMRRIIMVLRYSNAS